MAYIDTNITKAARPERLNATVVEGGVSLLIGLAVTAAIIYGYLHRDDQWINPEHGIGYWLGISGGSMMLILLAYPVRKRVKRPSRAAGSVGFWFRFHMLLGLAGPLAVLFHSRFTWGALNSAVALFAMLIVAGSGLIGRFLYSRVHRGYSNRKLEMRSLRSEMDGMMAAMYNHGLDMRTAGQHLMPLEEKAVHAGSSFWTSAQAVFGLGIRSRVEHRRLDKQIKAVPAKAISEADREELLELGNAFFLAIRRAAEFAFYDRMLRLWHLLHLPLFFLLIAATTLHIVAVHMY